MVCHVYMLTNAHKTVLYTGVTMDLVQRMEQHRAGMRKSFAWRYNANRLVYAEPFDDLAAAQEYEARLKRPHRAWKEQLISEQNPDWLDLADGVIL